MTGSLFGVCVLPGCATPVIDAGDTCDGCLAAFGSMLRPSDTRLTADEVRERDAYVARAYHAQRSSR